MTAHRLVFVLIAALGAAGLSACTSLDESPDNHWSLAGNAAQVPPNPQLASLDNNPRPERSASGVEMIRRAEDPSSAVDAYTKAAAVEGNKVAAQKAYVRRMVEFGLPEMAESQAESLT